MAERMLLIPAAILWGYCATGFAITVGLLYPDLIWPKESRR